MNRTVLLRVIGILSFILGIILLLSLNNIVYFIIRKLMAISPGSALYRFWEKIPYPIYLDMYLFNCTNPDQLIDDNYVPELEQLGPYRFNEYREKRNITWNDNHTVTYEQFKYWYFDAENSNGSLDDICTSLNPVPLTASYMSRNWSSILTVPLSAAIQSLLKSIWVTKTVGEMLFQGYSDPMLSVAGKIPSLGMFTVPAEKMGHYYNLNGTSRRDGITNVDTGDLDISKKGILQNWNYKNRSGVLEGACGLINGNTGEVSEPMARRDRLVTFLAELCRSAALDFVEDTEVLGIPGRRYVLNNSIFDNGTSDPDTKCSCAGQCLRQGVLNASSCYFGAPVFLSNPHFTHADPYYSQRVKGMKPDPEIHSTYTILEPITGGNIGTVAEMQINFYLQRNPKITLYKNVPDIMFPIIYLREEWRLHQDIAPLMRPMIAMPTIGFYLSLTLLLLGSFLLIFTCPLSVLKHIKKSMTFKSMR